MSVCVLGGECVAAGVRVSVRGTECVAVHICVPVFECVCVYECAYVFANVGVNVHFCAYNWAHMGLHQCCVTERAFRRYSQACIWIECMPECEWMSTSRQDFGSQRAGRVSQAGQVESYGAPC